MGVPEQGVNLLFAELRGGESPTSIVQSDKVGLTCGEVWNAKVPFVAELCSKDAMEFVGVLYLERPEAFGLA